MYFFRLFLKSAAERNGHQHETGAQYAEAAQVDADPVYRFFNGKHRHAASSAVSSGAVSS